jgi:hypothetical protein
VRLFIMPIPMERMMPTMTSTILISTRLKPLVLRILMCRKLQGFGLVEFMEF